MSPFPKSAAVPPLKYAGPATSKVCKGEVVPIPTLPDEDIAMRILLELSSKSNLANPDEAPLCTFILVSLAALLNCSCLPANTCTEPPVGLNCIELAA